VKACYPGSFDPVTNGHLDVIERMCRVADAVVVAVAINESKTALFSIEERVEMLEEVTSGMALVEVSSFKGLIVDFCRSAGADLIVKGLRAVTDFDYELQMAQMNSRLGVDTVFMPTNPQYSFVGSTRIKEVVRLGGTIEGLVPPLVEARLKERLRGS
jgi:pantetheine-phosphate adenylyltransferase